MSKYAKYAKLAEENGIKYSTFYLRVAYLKWSPEKAATEPPHPKGIHEYAVYRGDELIVIGTAKECAEYMGVRENTIRCYASPKRKEQAIKIGGTYAIKLEDDEDE